ncbi:hypothetical protein KPSA1_06527 [Pseudomonas syringae pv. actinidiae]|uniref:Uncharacterized protein n=1 Tax=Pseudomonas syringae pv. actinidiae TaxID=103796 RepID=A0A2V0QJR9_PSESF|nr:hypothetical protein KPSA1_06527 [Pseudomonas syringae pv. actinidiae]
MLSLSHKLRQEVIVQEHGALLPVFNHSSLKFGAFTVSIGRLVFGARAAAKPKWITHKYTSA